MRITKKQLVKSNERKNEVIFILLAIVFVLSITVSCQFVEIQNINKEILKSTNDIKNILLIGESNGN